MGKALDEFNARLAGINSDINFVAAASRFRPYSHASLDSNTDAKIRALAQKFVNIKDSSPEDIYGSLSVRLAASLERYLRSLLQESLSKLSVKAGTFNKVPKTVANKNIMLTGRLLANWDKPRDHLKIDVSELVKNLASCVNDSELFALNTQAFSAALHGVTDESVEECLAVLDIENFWDGIFNDQRLKQLLETDRTPDAKKDGRQRLKDLSRWRNNWAHGGDDEPSLTETELMTMSSFIGRFVEVIDGLVNTRISRRN